MHLTAACEFIRLGREPTLSEVMVAALEMRKGMLAEAEAAFFTTAPPTAFVFNLPFCCACVLH